MEYYHDTNNNNIVKKSLDFFIFDSVSVRINIFYIYCTVLENIDWMDIINMNTKIQAFDYLNR